MQFPPGTKFNKWSLHQEIQKAKKVWVIRRWAVLPNGQRRMERLSTEKYLSIRNNESELRLFLIRINEQSKEERTRKAVEIKHAFISPKLLDDYRDFLIAQIPSRHKAVVQYNYMCNYFLNFFINIKKMPDPLQWHKIHQTDWANYLASNDVPASAWTKRDIINAANRFMAWLHIQRPEEVKPLVFEPFTQAKFKEFEAIREMNKEKRIRTFIKDEHWILIKHELNKPEWEDIRSLALVADQYGLRRAETLGLKPDDIKKGHLSVERQLAAIPDPKSPRYAILKGRQSRKVPHWNCKPEEVYKLILDIQARLIHPDTLSDRWLELMKELHFSYDFHCIRHRWTTKMLRIQIPRDVQLAAGHKNIETTMGYAQDDRESDNEQFIPDAS